MDAKAQFVLNMFKGCDLVLRCGKCSGEIAVRSVNDMTALANDISTAQSFGMALVQAKMTHRCP